MVLLCTLSPSNSEPNKKVEQPVNAQLRHWWRGNACRVGRMRVVSSGVSDSWWLWTVAHQDPLSMGFPRQEYGSRLLLLSPGDLPDPGIQPRSQETPGGILSFKMWLILWTGGTLSYLTIIYGSGKQRVKVKVAIPTLMPSDPLAESVLPFL